MTHIQLEVQQDNNAIAVIDYPSSARDQQDSGDRGWQFAEAVETQRLPTTHLKLRTLNASFWSAMATRHGGSLSATASTPWVRTASLRRLKRVIRPGDRVLDVGCGNGSSLLGPLSSECRAYGVDMTEEMLRNAKKHHPEARGLCRSDACSLPFQSGSFDVVYSSRCVINVLTEEMQHVALSEIFRVVKPNGTVVLMENFEEPMARMNQVREVCRAGPPIVDTHNLQLNLQRTLEYSRSLGWTVTRTHSNTWASFVANVLMARIARRRGSWFAGRILHPMYVSLCWLEDHSPVSLPLFGKDTTVVLSKASDQIPPALTRRALGG
jgi:ubiquinone/menaquinone biosynthesis C-methylase UbiE